MVYGVVFTPDFSLTLPTTQKSTELKVSSRFESYLIQVFFFYRILLASIRNRGKCPCPRCLIPLTRVHNLGMARDMSQRLTLARVDDNHHQNLIATARGLIYEKNYAVDSTAVENLLKEHSLVPTTVCVNQSEIFVLIIMHTRTPSRIGYHPLDWTGMRCSSSISCMNLNLAAGSPCSSIFFEF